MATDPQASATAATVEGVTVADDGTAAVRPADPDTLVSRIAPRLGIRVQLEQIDIARRIIARYPDHLRFATTVADIRAAHRAGVKIAFGTDSGVFEHGRNGEEAELMVRLGGMSPRAGLVSATLDPARLDCIPPPNSDDRPPPRPR